MDHLKVKKKRSKVKQKAQELLAADQSSTMNGKGLSPVKTGMMKKTSRSRKKEAILSRSKKISKENVIQVDVDEIDESTESSRKKKPKVDKVEANVEVVQISSLEDFNKGMKKWLNEYQKSRPGLRILQQNIDGFMTDYEAQNEKERKEKDAKLEEDGFKRVEHHKGRKKTTDSESEIAIGSVAQAAVMSNMTKKKKKEIPLDFYRFQKREARMSEIMMLQSKFELDKKRIQELRAARKFRRY